ncbi:hypothetical protein JTB14_032868 [Gonioctena quinquepunctata]|nr:hypothetical protein JTB14_032868 [Gonioctena quinquepunctata]
MPRLSCKRKKDSPPPPRRARPPRHEENIQRMPENADLEKLLSAMDELRDLIVRRPILAKDTKKHASGISIPNAISENTNNTESMEFTRAYEKETGIDNKKTSNYPEPEVEPSIKLFLAEAAAKEAEKAEEN